MKSPVDSLILARLGGFFIACCPHLEYPYSTLVYFGPMAHHNNKNHNNGAYPATFNAVTQRDGEMKKVIAAIVATSIAVSGCSTFVPKTQTVSAICSEPDATLQINGQVYQGKAQVEAKRNKAVSVMCTKPGYFPAQKTIDYSLSETGVADVVGTVFLLLPGIGLFTAGAWKLDETDVNLAMVKSEK